MQEHGEIGHAGAQNRYRVTFDGRKLGALGVTYPHAVTVWANFEADVTPMLYKFYEHLTSVLITHEQVPS
jgi:hypothetical protein